MTPSWTIGVDPIPNDKRPCKRRGNTQGEAAETAVLCLPAEGRLEPPEARRDEEQILSEPPGEANPPIPHSRGLAS